MSELGLCVQNVTFGYRNVPVLRNVSLDFTPGRLTVICGPNGSGKSTLLNVAAAQARPTEGSVKLDGSDLIQLTTKIRARSLAMLPQSPEAPPELTVRDLASLGRYAYRTPLSGLSDQDQNAIQLALMATDMADMAPRALAALSGGQRQRAWIAMTLAQGAPWLLLDEPTNHLDVTHATEAMELLKMLVKRDQKSVVVVLHDINLMARFADDVVLMHNGSLAGAGPFEEAVTEARLSALYGRTCRFGTIPDRSRPFIYLE